MSDVEMLESVYASLTEEEKELEELIVEAFGYTYHFSKGILYFVW